MRKNRGKGRDDEKKGKKMWMGPLIERRNYKGVWMGTKNKMGLKDEEGSENVLWKG